MQDNETGVYAQPDVTSGELPATAQQYAQIQWQEEYLGDMVYDKPPKFLVSEPNCNISSSTLRTVPCVHACCTSAAYASDTCIRHACTRTSNTKHHRLVMSSNVAHAHNTLLHLLLEVASQCLMIQNLHHHISKISF